METSQEVFDSIEENTTMTSFEVSNTTEAQKLIKICVNSTEDTSQPKELQFVRNIVFWNIKTEPIPSHAASWGLERVCPGVGLDKLLGRDPLHLQLRRVDVGEGGLDPRQQLLPLPHCLPQLLACKLKLNINLFCTVLCTGENYKKIPDSIVWYLWKYDVHVTVSYTNSE